MYCLLTVTPPRCANRPAGDRSGRCTVRPDPVGMDPPHGASHPPLWLHFLALRRNLAALRYYVAHHVAVADSSNDGGIWVDAGRAGYSFHLCNHCVDAVVRD
jgi:hypothetical protein